MSRLKLIAYAEIEPTVCGAARWGIIELIVKLYHGIGGWPKIGAKLGLGEDRICIIAGFIIPLGMSGKEA